MNKERFTLPKGPTIAGTAVIAFLIGGMIFGYIAYYVTKKFVFPCPVCVQQEQCQVFEDIKD